VAVVPLDVAPATEADVVATAALAEALGAAWVVIDGYAFDDAYVAAVGAARPVLLIDDRPRGLAAPTLLLNQNLYARAADYPNLAQERLLLGGEYALLRREYAAPAPVRKPGPVERILVTLGGADPDNVTARVAAALGDLPGSSPHVRVVIGAAHPAADAVARALRGAGFEALRDVRDMLALQDWADVAIGAAGTTSLELASRGLPAVQLVLMDNQVRVAAELERRGIAISCGEPDDHLEVRIRSAVEALASWPRRAAMSEAGRRLVDGQGASRVAARLLEPR
jgi:spore coat polysaccharide biosynthesis predicted glycosyltransferase SpsG